MCIVLAIADSFVVIGDQPEKLLAAVRETGQQEIIHPDENFKRNGYHHD